MEKYMIDILNNINDHIKDTGDWSACDNNYLFNSGERVTPDDVMRIAGNLSFWKSYADGISAGPTPTETGVDLTKPPSRRPITIVSYTAVVQKQSSKGASQNNQYVDATTMASTISGDSSEPRNDAGIDDLKRKIAEIDTHREKYAKQQQKVEDDVNTLTDSMHNMVSDIINIRKYINGLSSQMKEITELLKQQILIKTSASNFIKSPPRQRLRTGNTGSGSVSSNEDTKRTWGSDCDSEMEEAAGKEDQNHVAMDTGGNSGQPSRPTATQKLHGGHNGELAIGEQEATLGGGSTGEAVINEATPNDRGGGSCTSTNNAR
jgi:hypothetical protein